jgi:type I restriction enzyme S subunit
LIAKKRDIKQGAMQQLLTGKTRLKGFTAPWCIKELGQIANVIMGQSPSSVYYNINHNGLPLIQGNADLKNRKQIGSGARVRGQSLTKYGRYPIHKEGKIRYSAQHRAKAFDF